MIKLMKSTFYFEEKIKRDLSQFIMRASTLSMGEECQRFEERFAQLQKRSYAVFVSSGSMANLLLVQALLNLGRLKKGARVAVSSLTWPTNIMPLFQLGLVPVALDCTLETLNVSNAILKHHNMDGINALFITNVLGFADDIEKIESWCQEHGIIFLEDNCESLGSKISERLLGNFSLASTFSFFVGHHFSTIEGGMVCTDDEELYTMLLLIRAHGWDRSLPPEKQQRLRAEHHVDDFLARYTFYDLAYNARPTEINGYLGNRQIEFFDEIVVKREANFRRFQSLVETNDELISLKLDHMETISNFAMPIVCKNEELFGKYRQRFEDNDVEIRPIIAGSMTKQPFYKKYVRSGEDCKNSDFIHRNGFYFPNNPELTEEEIEILCRLLKK